MSTETKNTPPNAYTDFHLQYIAGEWKKGDDDSINTDTNPYNGDTLVEIQQATDKQLDWMGHFQHFSFHLYFNPRTNFEFMGLWRISGFCL